MNIFFFAPLQFILGAVNKLLSYGLVHLRVVHVGTDTRGVQGLMRPP